MSDNNIKTITEQTVLDNSEKSLIINSDKVNVQNTESGTKNVNIDKGKKLKKRCSSNVKAKKNMSHSELVNKIDSDEEDTDTVSEKRRRINLKNFEFLQKNWSTTEKVELYNSLLKHGSSNIALLSKGLDNKSEEVVGTYLSNLKGVARHRLKSVSRKAPVDKWLDFLIDKDNVFFKKETFDVARALKYISLFEPHTDGSDINVRDCYDVIAECLKGEAPKHMSQTSSLFLSGNFQKLAKKIKLSNRESEESFLKLLNSSSKKEFKSYSRKKTDTSTQESSNNSTSTSTTTTTTTTTTTITATTNNNNSEIINPLNVPDSLLLIKK